MKREVNENTRFDKIKEGITKHKYEILGGVSIVGTIVGGTMLYRRQVRADKTIEFVRDIVRESSLKDAIDTTMNKIKYRETKLMEIATNGLDDFSIAAKQKYESELAILYVRLADYTNEYNSITIT